MTRYPAATPAVPHDAPRTCDTLDMTDVERLAFRVGLRRDAAGYKICANALAALECNDRADSAVRWVVARLAAGS